MKTTKDHSRFLSLVLRHEPGKVGLTLDGQGWVLIDDLLKALPFKLSRDDLTAIVQDNDKQRFALSPDGAQIRANQGHSVEVDLNLTEMTPPDLLFHGTAAATLPAILAEGLNRQSRHHVHLSGDPETARKVGSRHGKPIVLQVDCRAMVAAGLRFYRAETQVWLTDAVPPGYLSILN